MSEPHPNVGGRKLGTYLHCSPQVIALALDQQRPNGEKRLGEILVEAAQISREDLLASILAQRIDRLLACPLFTGLDRDTISALASGFEELSVPAGTRFIEQDSPEHDLFVLASGRLEVYRTSEDGQELTFSTVYPGEPIGEMGYFSGGVRSASVRALEDSELLRIHYDRLSGCFERSPHLAEAFVNIVSERLRKTNQLYQENQARLRTTERSLKQLNEFLDLSDAAELGAGIEGLIERLVRTASSITDADRATLFLIDPATGELWSKVAEGAEVKEIRVPAGAGIVGWVAQHKRLLNIPDAYEDERFNPSVDRRTGYRTRTILCAPMWSLRNEILGVVQVINKRIGIFNEDDEALLRAFAHQAAVAVENFNLYRRMMLSHKKMAIMLDIATSLGRSLDLGTLISQIVSKTIEVLQCDRASFFVLDEATKELWSMEAHGSELKEIRFPMHAGLAGHVATTAESINIADAYADARFNREFDQRSGYRTRSVLACPVFDRAGKVAGVIQSINKLDGRFDDEDLELLRAVASQIGVALENAKLHASTLDMKNYLESVQQSISDGIITLDRDFSVVTANKAAAGLLRELGRAEEAGDIRAILGAGNSHICDLLERAYRTRLETIEYDAELHGCGDGPHTVNVNAQPLNDPDGEFQGLVLVLEDITSEKRIKSAFSHYLAPAVIEQLLADPNRLTLGGEKRELTFLFTDIAGFTSLSEAVEPGTLMKLLNEYFDEMCGIALRHGGTIDKIVGDALHVMFNAPTEQRDHAERAVRCALDLADFCESFMARQNMNGIPMGSTRIGVNTGWAVVGNFGGTARFDYTAYGDPINTAARLEGANRYVGTRICISRSTKAQCRSIACRPVGRLVLKGKTEPIDVFEPLAETQPEKLDDYLHAYELMEREDGEASERFRSLWERFPTDKLIAFHARRLASGDRGATITLSGK
jgi:adenylate cyclase